MTTEKASFLPFHAINEFMLPEYRQQVIQTVFQGLDQLSPERRASIVNAVKKLVSVPGFRNSAQAPLPMKIKGAVKAFEKTPLFVGLILSAWMELNPELAKEVYDLLAERGWEMLPLQTDRSVLPGFLTRWPSKETYETLDEAYAGKYPESRKESYDIRLMIVWLGGRLPYTMASEEETN